MKKVNFNNGQITKNILQTALPMLVAQVLNLLYSIVDRIYIGRIPDVGTEGLGAVGLCFPIIILITGFTNMFGLGGSPLFSMALGSGDRKKAEAIHNTAFRLLLLTGVVITIAGELFGGPLLLLFGATQAELPMSMSYLRIYLLGTIFIMIATGMNAYINAQGFALIGMMSVTIGAGANLVLDPVFMFGMGLGVQGAAIATVISQVLSFLYVCRFLWGKQNEFRIRVAGQRKKGQLAADELTGDKMAAGGGKERQNADVGRSVASFRSGNAEQKNDEEAQGLFPYAKEIISLGTAPFIMQVTNSLVSIACNNVLMHFGGSLYVSIMTIVSSVRSILDVPVMAVTEGSSPIISFNYGAKRPENVKKAVRVMMSLAVPYTFVVWVIILVAPQIFVRIFSNDAEILADASEALHLYFMAFIFQSLQYSGQTVFKALNKKGYAIFFSLFRKVIMVVPLTYILPYVFGMGTDGVFIAEPVSNVIGGLACFITMLVTVWPELKKMGEKQ